MRTRTLGGIRGPQGEAEAGYRTWCPGGEEPADHDQHALTAVRTAPTGREWGQLTGGRLALSDYEARLASG